MFVPLFKTHRLQIKSKKKQLITMRTKLILPALMLAQLLCGQSSDLTAKLLQKEQEVRDLSLQVKYYKTVLNSTRAIRSATFENIRFDLTQVTGSRKDGSLVIGFSYNNVGDTRKTLQCERALLVDMQGNQHQTTLINLAPNGKVIAYDVLPKVPYRGAIIYKKLNYYFPVIRSLVLYIYPKDNISNPSPVVFENVPVIWD